MRSAAPRGTRSLRHPEGLRRLLNADHDCGAGRGSPEMWGGLMSVRREEGEHSSDLGRGGSVEAHGDGEALPGVRPTCSSLRTVPGIRWVH